MIKVSQLRKWHGEHETLKGIDFAVARGEVSAIIGPSGGGKSTFLRCLNGLDVFQQGQVQIGPHTIESGTQLARNGRLLQGVRKIVGMVFQQFNLFPHLTVMQNLTEAPLRVLNETRESAEARAVKYLERVGLSQKQRALPRDLSGGQQQRVAIARALMMEPQVMLFDEPTSALDPVMANEVLNVMGDLAKSGQTMVVVTHSMHFARDVAGRIHVFADGREVEQGAPDQIFSSPAHDVTRSFLRSASNR